MRENIMFGVVKDGVQAGEISAKSKPQFITCETGSIKRSQRLLRGLTEITQGAVGNGGAGA